MRLPCQQSELMKGKGGNKQTEEMISLSVILIGFAVTYKTKTGFKTLPSASLYSRR